MSSLHQLQDGRVLGYEEYGASDGRATLFYFHGTPGARLEWRLFGGEMAARRLGVRVIATDRPGMGLSTFQPGRRLRDWPLDVLSLADHLRLEKFSVLGCSGGGPYALVCAVAAADRLAAVGVVAGLAPLDQPGVVAGMGGTVRRFLQLARAQPALCRSFLRMLDGAAHKQPGLLLRATKAGPDRAVMANPDVQQAFLAEIREALRGGPCGAQLDAAIVASPWGFQLEDIPVPVHLWHGEQDRNVPAAMGRYLAISIPASHATFYRDEAHLSLMRHHAHDILVALGGASDGGGTDL